MSVTELSSPDVVSAERGPGGGPVGRTPRLLLADQPSEAEQRRVNQVLQMFETARGHRRPLVARWKECYRMLTNRYWNVDARPGWMPSPQIPEIFPIICALAGYLTDQRVMHTISPASLPNTEMHRVLSALANDLEAAMDAGWQANHEEAEWGKVCWDALVYGTGIAKTSWELQLAGGLGDAMSRRVDPFGFYPDPAARTLDDGNFMVEFRRMSLQELDRRWPGTADLFPQGGVAHQGDESPTLFDLAGQSVRPHQLNPGSIAPATGSSWHPVGRPKFREMDMPDVSVLEAWVREHTHVKVAHPNGGAVPAAADGWRCLVVAGNRLILDEPAEALWGHGSHPYSRFVPFDLGEFWGFSHVELMISPQKAINRLLAAMQQNVELTGNPIWKESSRSNTQRTQMTNRPGSRVTVAANDPGAGWESPPQLNGQMMELVRYFLSRMEVGAGVNALMRGHNPGGRPSGSSVDAMQDAAHVRVRMMLRNMEHALRDAGHKKAGLIVENYTAPRFIATAGPGGERSTQLLRGHHFMLAGAEGRVPLKYQLQVDAGSRRHSSKAMREDRAAQLLALGAYDERAFLHAIDEPNADEIADRVEAKQAQGLMNPPGKRERARA